MTEPTAHALADAIAAAMIELDEDGRRLAVALYEMLADGDPVEQDEAAQRAGIGLGTARALLGSWPGVFRGEDGRIVGFWGLAIPPMTHRFHADGGKPIHAWCALDPFLVVPIIGRSARVESRDPVSGEPVTMTVTPGGVRDPSPSAAVVSFVIPDKPFDHDVIQTFCHYVLNFASRRTAETWAAERDGIVLYPVEDAFEIGARAWSALRT